MRYILILGIALIAAGCGSRFSVNNPNPYSVYNYDYSDCCQQGNGPRP